VTPSSLVVTGACYAPGLRDALSLCLPRARAQAFAPWDLDHDEGRAMAAEAVRSSEVWLSMWTDHNGDLERLVGPGAPTRLRIPTIVFAGFHPDIVYAADARGEVIREPVEYKSAIALWGWKHGLRAADVTTLYRRDIFSALHYDEYWSISVDELRAQFDESDLEFSSFWRRTKRLGVFMHTFNHPTIATIALLAKSIAMRLGAPTRLWDEPIERYLTDELSHIVWPIYPEIGELLGLEGCYRWRIGPRQFATLGDWVAAEFAGLDPYGVDAVSANRDLQIYDAVLGELAVHVERA